MKATKDPKASSRSMLVRGALAVVYISVMALAFVSGKGHEILLDNKDSEDGSVKAIENLVVSVDGLEPIDMPTGIRDSVKVHGQKHRVEFRINDQKTVKTVSVPVGEDMLLLSLPKLWAGKAAVMPFVPLDTPPPPPEPSPNINDPVAPVGPLGVPATPGAPAAPGAPPVLVP